MANVLMTAYANDIVINENTAPEIREKYEALKTAREKRNNIYTDYTSALSDNAAAMHEKENSWQNKLIGAAGIGATGIGGTMLGSALSEMASDAEAEAVMRQYLESFRCDYGDGKLIHGGEVDVELPGGNDMMNLYAEYTTLADDLKSRKEALGMRPGIESEIVISKDDTGLYEYTHDGITGGSYASIARAILYSEGPDADMWAAQKQATANKLKAGAIVAGVGAVGSLAANITVNKDAPKENSAQIKSEYESRLAATDAEIQSAESELNAAIDNNKKRVDEYNTNLAAQQNYANSMTNATCRAPFAPQIAATSAFSTIDDKYANIAKAPVIPDISKQKTIYDHCVLCMTDMMGQYDFQTDECECVEPLPDLINGRCMPHISDDIEIEDIDIAVDNNFTNLDLATPTIATMPVISNTTTTTEGSETDTDADMVGTEQCPANNPRLKTITDKDRVGGFCKYGHITIGKIYKITSGNDAGTCSCTATACESGYEVKSGRCVETENATATMTAAADTQPQTVDLQYKHVCTTDKGKTGKPEHCVESFAKLSILPMQATAIAMEYAQVRDHRTIICDGTSSTPHNAGYATNASYVACTTKDGSHFYDFKFQSTDETGDNALRKNAADAICTIHNVKSHPSATGKCYYKNNLQSRQNTGPQLTGCEGAYCDASNESQCKQINQTAKQFGYSTVWWSNRCYISFNDMSNPYGNGGMDYVLKTAYGINNQEFCSRSIQVKGSAAIIKMLEDYTKQNANEKITSFNCASSPRKFKKGPCGGDNDDVVTCWANGKQIDFIFDDVSESWNKIAQGGQQGMSCIVGGGRFSGRRCIGLGEEMCNKLAASNLTNCPECKAAKWDTKTKSCVLPSSMTAAKIQKGIDISIIVGGAVVAAAITVALPPAGATVGTYVLVGIETAGAAMETYAQVKINHVADNFLISSNQCNNESCAAEIIQENFKHVARTGNDFTDAEAKLVGDELARLLGFMDDESYAKFLNQFDSSKDGQLSLDDNKGWTGYQVLRAFGIALQFASLATAGVEKLAQNSPRVEQALNVMKTRINKAITNGDIYWDAGVKRWRSKSTGRFTRNPNAPTTPATTTRATTTATTSVATTTGNSADTILNSAKAKLAEGGESFDEIFAKVKQGGGYPASWKTSDLTADELAALNKQLEADGYKLIDDGTGYLKFEKTTTPASTGAATGTHAGATKNISIGKETATQRIETEMAWGTQHGLPEANGKIIDIQMQYLDEAEKALTEADAQRAFLAYHQRIVDYTSTLFNRSKASQIAKTRRAEYLRVIASDDDLFRQSQNWANLSKDSQERFLRTVIERADKQIGSGKSFTISFDSREAGAGYTDYMNNGNIFVTLQDYPSLGLKPTQNLDDAMHILAHEHAHNIMLNAPSKSSISEDVVSTIILHNEDEHGLVAYLGNKQLTGKTNYSKLLQEQEGKLIGQEVGNGFSTELRKVRQSYTPSSSGATIATTGTRTRTTTAAASGATRKTEYVAPRVSVVDTPSQESLLFAKQHDLDIIDPRTLSDEDLVYYINWRKYAPGNQSFAQYKASFQDDVWGVKDNLTPFERMQKQATAMRTPEEFATTASADLDDMYIARRNLRDRRADISDKIDSETDPEKLKALREEQKIINQDLEFLDENIKNYENGIYLTSNYSTFDPEIAKTTKAATADYKRISDLWDKREAEYWAEYQKTIQEAQQYNLSPEEYQKFKDTARRVYESKLDLFTASDDYMGAKQQLSRNYIKEVEAKLAFRESLDKGVITESRYRELINKEGWKKISDAEWSDWYLRATGHKSLLQNLDEIALQRADLYTDIITSDPELIRWAKNFNASEQDYNIKMGQRILDKVASANGTSAPKLRSALEYKQLHPKADIDWNGMSDGTDVWIDFDAPKEQSFEGFINTLSHEQGHNIDHINPNNGALGSQLEELSELIYRSDAGRAFYLANPTEKSSWTIGPIVSKRVLEALSKL